MLVENKKGYQGCTVAGEDKDCVVRAFARATDMPYEVWHKICEKRGRKAKHGMNVYRDMMKGKRAVTIKGFLFVKHVRKIKSTIPKFLKKNPVGTFIGLTCNHAFTVINGTIYNQAVDGSRVEAYLSVKKVIKKEKVSNITL